MGDVPEVAPTTAGDALPSPQDLFERHIEAIGGRDKVFAPTTRRLTGRFEMVPSQPGGQTFRARLQMVQEAPDKLRFELNVPGQPSIVTVFDGEIGWASSSEGRYEIVLGPQLIDLALSAQFYGEADYEKRYAAFGDVERVMVNDEPAYRVAYQTRFGKPGAVIFDAESGLATVFQTVQSVGEEQGMMLVQLEDYRPVGDDGPLFPRRVVQTTPTSVTTLTYRTVDHELDADPDWTRPEAVQARFEELQRMQREAQEQRGEREGGGSPGNEGDRD
ncbi:MAG: hypothetical protein EA378_01640 [Phycisphaerales bacterium]|nr:MAG: hypothetical protein EA378_01640 [Phycisphaerales bacterium]